MYANVRIYSFLFLAMLRHQMEISFWSVGSSVDSVTKWDALYYDSAVLNSGGNRGLKPLEWRGKNRLDFLPNQNVYIFCNLQRKCLLLHPLNQWLIQVTLLSTSTTQKGWLNQRTLECYIHLLAKEHMNNTSVAQIQRHAVKTPWITEVNYRDIVCLRNADIAGELSFSRGMERKRELVRSQTLPRSIGAQARRSIFERLDSENR